MASRKLLLLPGDGIGPETMAEVEKLVTVLNETVSAGFTTETALVGGSAYDAEGAPVSNATMDLAMACDAVLFGAVGGPKWDGVPYDKRPEAGLLRLRKDMELFANLRPAICYPALADASSLKREIIEGLDAGGDDYLTKPFSLDELLARLRAITRRERAGGEPLLRLGDLGLDPASREVHRGDRKLSLSRTEFKLIELFLRRKGRVLAREAIIDAIWGYGTLYVTTETQGHHGTSCSDRQPCEGVPAG